MLLKKKHRTHRYEEIPQHLFGIAISQYDTSLLHMTMDFLFGSAPLDYG